MLSSASNVDEALWLEKRGCDAIIAMGVEEGRKTGASRFLFAFKQNRHVDGILDVSAVPAMVSPKLADRTVGLAMAITDALSYVGVLAVERVREPQDRGQPLDELRQVGAHGGFTAGEADPADAVPLDEDPDQALDLLEAPELDGGLDVHVLLHQCPQREQVVFVVVYGKQFESGVSLHR